MPQNGDRDPNYPVGYQGDPLRTSRRGNIRAKPEGRVRRLEGQLTTKTRQSRAALLGRGYAATPLPPHRENVSFRIGIGKAARRVKGR
jgi:hypothetical protein